MTVSQPARRRGGGRVRDRPQRRGRTAGHPRRAGPHAGAVLAGQPGPDGPGQAVAWVASLDGPQLTGSNLPTPNDATAGWRARKDHR